MSESSFPFGSEPPAETTTDVEEGSGRRTPLLLGGLGVLVLAAGGFFLLGGEDPVDDGPISPARAPLAAAAPAPETVVVPVAATEPVGRNPFKALYVAPAAGGGGAAAPAEKPVTTPAILEQSKPTTTPPTTTTTTAQPTVQPTAKPTTQPVTQPTTAPPAPAPEPTPSDDGTRYPITLENHKEVVPEDNEVDAPPGEYVIWGYGGKGFEVLPGQTFGRFSHLRVVQVVDDDLRKGVMLQIGDGSPFFVAVGETVYVL